MTIHTAGPPISTGTAQLISVSSGKVPVCGLSGGYPVFISGARMINPLPGITTETGRPRSESSDQALASGRLMGLRGATMVLPETGLSPLITRGTVPARWGYSVRAAVSGQSGIVPVSTLVRPAMIRFRPTMTETTSMRSDSSDRIPASGRSET